MSNIEGQFENTVNTLKTWGQTERSLDILFRGVSHGKLFIRQDKPALRNARSEFAGCKALEGAEALGQFDSGQAVLAIEPAKEVRRGMRALPGVAFDATGHQVAASVTNLLDEYTRLTKPQASFNVRNSNNTLKER